MATRPEYRFRVEIADQTADEVVIADWLTITPDCIDQFGGCESAEHIVARLLRAFQQTAREQHERANYQQAGGAE